MVTLFFIVAAFEDVDIGGVVVFVVAIRVVIVFVVVYGVVCTWR